MPEQTEKPSAPRNEKKVHNTIAQSLDLEKSDIDTIRVFIDAVKNTASSLEEKKALQESFEKQWRHAYLDAGYDIEQTIKLPTFSNDRIEKLSKRLDAIIASLEQEFSQLKETDVRLQQHLQQLAEEIDKALEETDVLTVKLNNEAKTPLHIRPLSEFNPLVKPGQKIDPRSLGMAQVVYEDPILNLKTTLSMDNPDTADIHEGIQAIGIYLTNTYFPQNKKMLEKFHVKDVKHMTPKQAILLASATTMERLKYSMDQINTNTTKNVNEQEINDTVAIDQLFQWERDENGNGVCRNYSAVMYGVFEALKSLQESDKSLLHNTYVLTLSSIDSDLPGAVNMHAWNGIVSLTDEGVHGMVIDTTWADSESSGNDPAQGGISSSSLDYTHERFFTLMNKFERGGVLPPETFFMELHESYKSMPKIEAKPITRETLSDRIRELPPRLQTGQRMMQLLVSTPKLARESENYLSDFFSSYAIDLTTYLDNINDTPDFTNRKALDSIVLAPFLSRLNVAYRVIDKQIDKGKQDWYRKIFNPVLKKYHQHFSGRNYTPYYADTSKELLEVAEYARHKEIANQTLKEEFVPHLEHNTSLSNYTKRELPEIYKRLDTERQEEYRKMLAGKLEFEEEKPERRARRLWEERIEKECGMRLSVRGYPSPTAEQEERTLTTFIDAYRQTKPKMSYGVLELENQKDVKNIKPATVTIHEAMSQQDMVEEIRKAQKLNERWSAIRGRCSCDLEIGWSGIEVSTEQLNQFLNNIESYFTDDERQHLLRYRQIEITYRDNTEDYLSIDLSKDHFIGKFDPTAIDGMLKVNDFEKRERERNVLQSRKNLQRLEKDPVLRGISAREIDSGNVFNPMMEFLSDLSAEKRQFLEKHPVRVVLKDAKDGLYGDKKSITDKGYPHYFAKSLSRNGVEKVLKEEIIAVDGTMLRDDVHVSDLLEENHFAQIERNGKRFPLVKRNRNIAIQVAKDRYESSVKKGDKIIVPANPTVRYNNSGYEIHLFVESTSEQVKQGLEEAMNRHIEWEQQNDRAKKLSITLRPSFYASEEMNEEHISRTRNIVDKLEGAKLDFSDFEDVTISVGDETCSINVHSRQFGAKYEIQKVSNVQELDTVLRNMKKVEKKAAAIAGEGVRFSADIHDGDYRDTKEKLSFDAELAAMDVLEKFIQGGKYKGYGAEIVDFRGFGWLPDPKEKNIHVDTIKKIISVHINK